MRTIGDRAQTIAALRRLAERPGSEGEGAAARRMLEKFGAKMWSPRVFSLAEFPRSAIVYYCYWCYRNVRGVVACDAPKAERGELWMRIDFDTLKQPRWVPCTSSLGCHLSREPFGKDESEVLYHLDLEWEQKQAEFMAKLKEKSWLHDYPIGSLTPTVTP